MTNTKGGTMTPEELAAIRRRCAWMDKHYDEAQYTGNEDRRALLAEVDRLTADLREYRNACEQKQEQIDSAKDVIKALTADLAKARGRGG